MWVQKIPNCFGAEDKQFAGHQSEVDAAIDLLRDLSGISISIDEVANEFEAWLRTQTSNEDHIQEQLQSVRNHYSAWVSK